MKRRFAIIAALIALLFCLMGAALTSDALVSGIYDDAELLSETERTSLGVLAEAAALEANMSFVILTTDEHVSGSYEIFCEEYFRSVVPGIYGTQPGVMLYVNMNDRDVNVAAFDDALDYFPQYRLDGIREDITPYLTDGDYARAIELFIEQSAEYPGGTHGGTDSPGYVSPTYRPAQPEDGGSPSILERMNFSVFALTLLGGILLVGVFLFALSRVGLHTAPVSPAVYVKNETVRVLHSQDIFLRTHTMKTPIPQHSGNSGGGSRGGSSRGGGGGGSRHSGGKF
ncbi:MAG: TPM domain-containing protein [Oscillospiraceae bacterium]|jgi:uncharacterized protein|nr:TPM domain-containing protein [Oscillospiraceae bacterium]